MSFTKFASFEVSEVLDVKGAASQQRTASLDKVADYHDYRTNDGYLYARIIAISSRVNKNNDGWPSVELAGGQEAFDKIANSGNVESGFTINASKDAQTGFSTFVGKPIFVDHNNSDTKRARGVIVDSKLHVQTTKEASLDPYYSSDDVDDEHLPPTKVELLLEIDAKSFPKLAQAIVEGSKDSSKGIDGFSMGCDVAKSKCSHCGNEASSPREYCSHIKMKGAEHKVTSGKHAGKSRKSYENCYGIKFFEISAVFDPADETALLQELIDENPGHESKVSSVCPFCGGSGCEECGGTGQTPEQTQVPLDRTMKGPSGQSIPVGSGGDGSMLMPPGPQTGQLIERPGMPPIVQGPEIMNSVDESIMSPGYLNANPLLQRVREQIHGPRMGSYLANRKKSEIDPASDPLQRHLSPDLDEVMQLANQLELENGMPADLALRRAEQILIQRNREDFGRPGAGDIAPELKVKDTMSLPPQFPALPQGLPNRQRNYGSVKTADNPLPQFMHTKSPEKVDTLREEKICPVCGEQMEGEKCATCGHIEPPEGFNNPDLDAAQNNDLTSPDMPGVGPGEAPNTDQDALLNGAPAPGEASAVSYLQSRKRAITPGLNSVGAVTAGKIKTQERPLKPSQAPATDEPQESVVSDQDRPVTSSFRTAMDLIRAAKSNQGNTMHNTNRIAAEAPSGVGAQKRVDVEGVGGVIDANNESASKPTGPHSYENSGTTIDVTGKGGIIEDSNAAASTPSDGSENLPTAGRDSDNAGFNKDKTTDDSGPTKTFDNSNEPGSAVTDKAFPTSAKQGIKPNGGADTQPQRRENVEQESGFSNPQKGTDQWTGTGGNGVTRQQDPVTKKVDPNIEQRSSSFAHVVAAMKLADAEIEIGVLDPALKYDRVAELEALTPEELAAEERVISRVKTAGLAKRTATRREAATRDGEVVGRVPSFQKKAGELEKVAAQPINDTLADASLFLR